MNQPSGTLLICEEEACKLRQLNEEVRCRLDAKCLVESAAILPQLTDTNMTVIVDKLLAEIENGQVKIDKEAVKRELFSVTGNDNMGIRFRKKVQLYSKTEFYDVNQHWMVLFAEIDRIKKRQIAIATLKDSTNMGDEAQEMKVLALVVAPKINKETKSAKETAQTLATLLARDELRLRIEESLTSDEVRHLLLKEAEWHMTKREARVDFSKSESDDSLHQEKNSCVPGKGIAQDLRKKLRFYASDYLDGIKDFRSVSKVISSTVFLIFTILPTSISYGILNTDNTKGSINVQKVILGQAIGGVIFGLFGGQQLLILSTSAPLSIYISVIYAVCQSNGWNFFEMYALVGIYAMLLLIAYALFQIAYLMKYTMRSTEEIFSMFIATTFTFKAISAMVKTYDVCYAECDVMNWTTTSLRMADGCAPSSALLFVFLVCGTVWLSLQLDSLRSSVYLHRHLRELLSDYALPLAVIFMALIAYLFFYNVDRENFPLYDTPDAHWIPFYNLPAVAHGPALGLAFPLSLLFFMDQLLVTNTIDNKQHNLAKGSSHHWDFLVVAVLNIVLSVVGLPWMHGALPQSFLHLKALSDVEERVHNGRMQQIIVRARETRIAVVFAHVLFFPIYFYLIPYLNQLIPIAQFHGLFLFMAISSLTGNEFWERVTLIFTDQRAYPPTHYLRRIPQRIVHFFTAVELLQLFVLFAVSFSSYHYIKMIFPVVIGLFIPFRHFVLPFFFKREYLEAIDSQH
ncbi:hypothetical protein WR25_08495 [Diploscapter pachys]|uniref:Bicarbonate transporter-like transmembrane domain-containing protein n=1 Tax=Diploscapter pachys TaxID=2018661 RepID=A0A2A2LFR1_9BILA|nr:hypothetical protein WR25_08495 [Diploscapter pachys]